MKISPFFIFLLSFIIFSTCKDRPRSNPFDPDTVLDTSQWAPSNLQVEVINDSQIHLTWEQEENRIDGFRILRKAGSSAFNLLSEVAKDTLGFTDNGLTVGVEYTYRVKAFTEENESGYTPTVSTTTSFPAPTNLTATPADDQSIQLTWLHSCSFEEGYRIERSEGGGFTQIAELGENVNGYIDEGVILSLTYTYRIKAFTETNESGYVTSQQISTSFPAPTDLTATAVDDQSIYLTWTHACSFEDGYRIERSDNGSQNVQIAELGENANSYTDNGLTIGWEYTYRVNAFTEENESEFVELSFNFWQDCSGLWNGNAVEDCAGICNGTTEEDCIWICGGYALIDDCNACSGGNSGHVANSDMDCNGECFGSAITNVCNYCVGGSTGFDSDYCPVTDYDGNTYETVTIGTQTWMAENLKTTHYKDGSVIPNITNNSEWGGLSTGAYGDYNNDPANANTYGRLYNWYAAVDSRGVCPEGWHVPTDAEWTVLTDYLGGTTVAGGKLKETGTSHWNSPNTGATNESGFTALPGGYRDLSNGNYLDMGSYGYFWSSTAYNSDSAWYRYLNYYNSNVLRYNYYKHYGFSIRCAGD